MPAHHVVGPTPPVVVDNVIVVSEWLDDSDFEVELYAGPDDGAIVVEAEIALGSLFYVGGITDTKHKTKMRKLNRYHDALSGGAEYFHPCRAFSLETGQSGGISIVASWQAGDPVTAGKPLRWTSECQHAIGDIRPELRTETKGGTTRLYLRIDGLRSVVRVDVRLLIWRA